MFRGGPCPAHGPVTPGQLGFLSSVLVADELVSIRIDAKEMKKFG